MAEFNKCLLYLLISLMVATGSINTIATKVQQKIKLNTRLIFEGHQWFTTYGMFIGEMILLIGYLVVVIQRTKKSKEPETEKNLVGAKEKENDDWKEPELPPANNCIFAISASCDLTATTLSTFGLTYLSSSMYQMFRGLELLFVMFFAKFFLGNPIYRHHIIGVGLVVFGLFLVGLNAFLFKDHSSANPGVGIILLIISQVFSSSQYVIQEKILVKYSVHSFQLVGFEGFWGFFIYTIILIIFQFIKCDTWDYYLKKNLCYGNLNNKYRLEDSILAFKQMGANVGLLLIIILYIVSIAVYNYVGINMTKLVSSTARAIVDTVRTVFVWFFFLWFPWLPDGCKETFYPLQLGGFVLLILGSLIYNEIVALPFWNLDYNTRDKITERNKQEEKVEVEVENYNPDDDQNNNYKEVDQVDPNVLIQNNIAINTDNCEPNQ